MSIAVRDAIGELDVLVSPIAPVAAFAAELPSPAGDPARALEHIAFTVPLNMSGHPAITVPRTTTSDGRPIGVRFVGRRFAELGVLRGGGMRGVAPDTAAMARRADALTAPGIDADRGALTVRRLRLPPARPRTRDVDPRDPSRPRQCVAERPMARHRRTDGRRRAWSRTR